MADRGRMEVETGMAHIYGYPDPNAANVLRNEPVRSPQSTAGTFGSGHTTGTSTGTGYTATGENDYERGDDVGGGVERGTNRYRTDDEYGQPGGQNFERQQPAIDGNKEKGPDPSWRDDLSPNRGPQNAESEVSQSSMSQIGVLTPTQQMKRGPPPELPPRAQAQATNDDHTTQMYQ